MTYSDQPTHQCLKRSRTTFVPVKQIIWCLICYTTFLGCWILKRQNHKRLSLVRGLQWFEPISFVWARRRCSYKVTVILAVVCWCDWLTFARSRHWHTEGSSRHLPCIFCAVFFPITNKDGFPDGSVQQTICYIRLSVLRTLGDKTVHKVSSHYILQGVID